MAKASTKRRNRVSTFFKVMLPGFFNELALPPKFTRNLKGKAYTMATIRDPLGRIWNVEMGGRGETLYFGGEGWMNFVKSLDIGLGFFLLFIHKGKRNFHVKVFDLTACEKEYADEECNVSKCSSQASELTLALYKPTETEAARNLEKMVKQFCKSLGPHFIRTMKFCNLRSEPYLNVPMEFLASYRLYSKCNVTLIDPNGGYWLVRLQIRKRRPVVQCCFHSGWHNFACKAIYRWETSASSSSNRKK
ncbi:hypothetical protein HPP92_016375 [Vanilla planifolia]|uniref:TF-B3 domain-containing protein n=1 Tax=Vanilla planifolia TaxID=51239 RepID=A0A835QFZ3_VANPL|nr:hypothetical protein HPP92_016375 [Vanilla planifolia]